ncbi:MAG: BrnT family toxin [Synergistaceae bacterium]|nr:BrnT family toxin [Synergistaceae bacterium]
MNDEIKFEFDGMIFTWDEDKAIANWKKHKVDFRVAAEIFSDAYAVDVWA